MFRRALRETDRALTRLMGFGVRATAIVGGRYGRAGQGGRALVGMFTQSARTRPPDRGAWARCVLGGELIGLLWRPRTSTFRLRRRLAGGPTGPEDQSDRPGPAVMPLDTTSRRGDRRDQRWSHRQRDHLDRGSPD
jgi:hypothetical protein